MVANKYIRYSAFRAGALGGSGTGLHNAEKASYHVRVNAGCFYVHHRTAIVSLHNMSRAEPLCR